MDAEVIKNVQADIMSGREVVRTSRSFKPAEWRLIWMTWKEWTKLKSSGKRPE